VSRTDVAQGILAQAFLRTAGVMALLLAWTLVAGLTGGDNPDFGGRNQLVPESVASLVRNHDCWPASASDQRSPAGHVVVTRPGRSDAEYLGLDWVRISLDHLASGRVPGLRVHAFCR
jgi:hypothetical protein